MRLADKTAFITGGGRGIGRAVAHAFAHEGARVFVVARTTAEVERVAGEIRVEFGERAAAHAPCDVADARSVESAFAAAREFFGGPLDVLVNNAGIAESSKFAETSDEFWRRHLDVNLTGTFNCMRAALPSMVERGWGRVINVASVAGKTGSVALEVARTGVTVNAVCPGYVDTDMTTRAVENIQAKTGRSASDALEIIKRMSPQQRLVTPEEVAALALLLASHEGRGITGQAINVDGGTVMF